MSFQNIKARKIKVLKLGLKNILRRDKKDDRSIKINYIETIENT